MNKFVHASKLRRMTTFIMDMYVHLILQLYEAVVCRLEAPVVSPFLNQASQVYC